MTGPPGSGARHARRADRRPVAAAAARGHVARREHRVGRGRAERRGPDAVAAVSRAAPHELRRRARRGRGSATRPREISLAHRGVLFLDELPEFGRDALSRRCASRFEQRREVARARSSRRSRGVPARGRDEDPCPCGYRGDGGATAASAALAARAIRGAGSCRAPLDRFDLQIDVPRVSFDDIADPRPPARSAAIREVVTRARERQFAHAPASSTRGSTRGPSWRVVTLGRAERAAETRGGSIPAQRAAHCACSRSRARSADLAASDDVVGEHVAEALRLRCRERT